MKSQRDFLSVLTSGIGSIAFSGNPLSGKIISLQESIQDVPGAQKNTVLHWLGWGITAIQLKQ